MKDRIVSYALSRNSAIQTHMESLEKRFSGLLYSLTGVSQFFSGFVREYVNILDSENKYREAKAEISRTSGLIEQSSRDFTVRINDQFAKLISRTKIGNLKALDSKYSDEKKRYSHYRSKLDQLNQKKNDKLIRMQQITAQE